MPSFIQSSYDLYTQGAIWLSYSYLLLFVTGVMTIFQLVYPMIFIIAGGLTVVSTVLLVLDIEQELDISKTKGPTLDNDTRFIDLEVDVE